jgi:2'-5' RNA ligase
MGNARHAVVLVLDDASASKVRALAEQLNPLPRATASAVVPPHVTLAVCTELEVTAFTAIVRDSVETTHALECTLASLAVFPNPEGVVFLGVAPSPELVGLHGQMFERLRQIGAQVEPYWHPGQWVPHCTLAMLPLQVIPAAIGRVIEGLAPITCVLTRILVVDIESVHVCCDFRLAPPEN